MSTNTDLGQEIQEQLKNIADVTFKQIKVQDRDCTIVYIQSIINVQALHEQIASPLISLNTPGSMEIDQAWNQMSYFTLPNQQISDPKQLAASVVQGNVVVCSVGMSSALVFQIHKYQTRGVGQSQNEQVVVGPQESFIEDIETNLSLLRHKIRHPEMKTVKYTLGRYSQTPVYVVYIEGLCNDELLQELEEQIQNIEIDGTFGLSYITEQFKASRRTPFPQFQYTERPDSVASSLLEGRIAILMDGSPSSLIVPVTLFSLLQSSEDYYQDFLQASWIRFVRFLFAVISFTLPSLYVAVTTFQPEMIPTELLLTIAAARENIPFSALTEALIMELTFEGLREAGKRIPKPIGQTISIIGAIVIGQAVVQAGIVSIPMVIVVSITGIAAYIIPHYELGLTFRLLRFPLLLIGGTTGMLGVLGASFIVYGHLCSLHSFGTPYMSPLGPFVWSDWKDTLFRTPFYDMRKRPKGYENKNLRRQPQK